MERKNVYDFFSTAWKLYKQFDRQPKDDTYWSEFADALKADDIKAMATTRFGLDLLHAVQMELERGGHG